MTGAGSPSADWLSGCPIGAVGASQTLSAAAEAEGLRLTKAARQILLGISRFEGGWGCSNFRTVDNDAVPTDFNWGALHAGAYEGEDNPPVPPPGALWDHPILASDTSTSGRYKVWFRGYGSQVDGARDYLRAFKRHAGWPEALQDGDAWGVAAAMYRGHYFGDYRRADGKVMTGDARIREYAEAIDANAAGVAKKLGESDLVHLGSRREGGGGVGLLLLLLAIGGGSAFVLSRRRK